MGNKICALYREVSAIERFHCIFNVREYVCGRRKPHEHVCENVHTNMFANMFLCNHISCVREAIKQHHIKRRLQHRTLWWLLQTHVIDGAMIFSSLDICTSKKTQEKHWKLTELRPVCKNPFKFIIITNIVLTFWAGVYPPETKNTLR